MKTKLFHCIFFLLLVHSGLITSLDAATPPVITIMTHDSFAVSEGVLKLFEKQYQAQIKILKIGDAGAALTQAILSKNNPLGDIFYGIDNTYMSRALKANIFEPYRPALLSKIPDILKIDVTNRMIPVDFGDVCLNYDIEWFNQKKIPFPKDLSDLTQPQYKSLLVVENPAISSPGLAFLFTTVGRFGESGYLDFWKQLRANDVYVSNGWTDAYYGQFSRAKGGTRPIVVSYGGSPPAEVFYSEKKLNRAPTAAMLSSKSAFRQIEFVGILKGTKHLMLAQKLVDFMLSPEFQKDIPLHMWVYPAMPDTPLPEVFVKYAQKANDPIILSPETISLNMQQWIEKWTTEVLH
ncbi:MAG: thiamine ABC transporter substrate-binding protein [Candidatus Magnetomorum sp.]|nr:thiamine ABC transporter substrate-binding protein [Candidatus Magnetomorum sp.]